MAEITLFWGEKEQPTFTWEISKSQDINQNQTAIHELESHQILKADLACLAEMAESNLVTLVLSSKDVTCAQVEVPNKAQRLLRKAVPYMLEDEMASSVDELFFALADKSKEKLLSVRAIDREYLESILDRFKQAEIKLANIYVDIDLIKVPEEGINLVIASSQCLSVDSDNKRWYCHQDDYSWLIQKQLKNDEDENELPVAIPLDIYSENETDEFVHQLPVGRFAVNSHQVDNMNEFLIEQKTTPINLLQDEYEVKKENSQLTNFLVKVASIAGFVLLAHLIYQGFYFYTLSEQKEQLDKQKITLYKQAFPREKRVRNPDKKMRVYIKSLGSQSGDADFLTLLISSSELLTDLEKIYPTNISYDSVRNELRLDVIAADLVVLDQYSEALKKAGHQVEKSSETQRGEGYSSRLTISK